MALRDKRGLVVGIANVHSVAYGCAKAFNDAGAELAVTYLNAKAEPFVRRSVKNCLVRLSSLAMYASQVSSRRYSRSVPSQSRAGAVYIAISALRASRTSNHGTRSS